MPPARAFGRSLADFGALGDAEQKLLESCRTGADCVIAQTRPAADQKTDANTIRAGFLRFLILGGDDDHPVHEHGVRVTGAWIAGGLDLDGVASTSDLSAQNCWFDSTPNFSDARIKGNLVLIGSRVPGLAGERISCDAGLFCGGGFVSDGIVQLGGAKLGGNLECGGGAFSGPIDAENRHGDALSLDNIDVQGDVFLNNGFAADGAVRLVGARIGGSLECRGAKFRPSAGWSLNAERLTVAGGFFFAEFETPAALVNLAFAHVGVLADDPAAWGGGLNLHGFTYDRIAERGKKDAHARLHWLDQQSDDLTGKTGKGSQFRPQPWLQLRKVLSESGHAEDARKVGIKLERRRRHCGQVKGPARYFHFVYGAVTGYGYRPMRLLACSLAVWFGCAVLYGAAAAAGDFAPTDTTVFATPDCGKTTAPCGPAASPPANWILDPPFAGHYPVFNPWIYSLNVFLPVVALGQESAWAPVAQPPAQGFWHVFFPRLADPGFWVQLAIWVETLFGWLAGLLLVAVVSGLARKQDDS
jgi:hypothetical protein